jgi:hypothetical protein
VLLLARDDRGHELGDCFRVRVVEHDVADDDALVVRVELFEERGELLLLGVGPVVDDGPERGVDDHDRAADCGLLLPERCSDGSGCRAAVKFP